MHLIQNRYQAFLFFMGRLLVALFQFRQEGTEFFKFSLHSMSFINTNASYEVFITKADLRNFQWDL